MSNVFECFEGLKRPTKPKNYLVQNSLKSPKKGLSGVERNAETQAEIFAKEAKQSISSAGFCSWLH